MERFHLDLTSILIQIDSSGARHVETDVRDGGTCDDLYPTADNSDFKKNILKTV
jgi:hypothetical protein